MEKPCQEIVMAGNLDGFRDVLMNHIWVNSLTHWHIAVRSHVDRKDTKSPATSGIAIHWGVGGPKQTYSAIHFFSKLPSPWECPAEKAISFLQ